MLLGQINGELVQHFSRVSLEGAEEGAVSVHNNKAEFVVVGQKRRQRFRVELK